MALVTLLQQPPHGQARARACASVHDECLSRPSEPAQPQLARCARTPILHVAAPPLGRGGASHGGTRQSVVDAACIVVRIRTPEGVARVAQVHMCAPTARRRRFGRVARWWLACNVRAGRTHTRGRVSAPLRGCSLWLITHPPRSGHKGRQGGEAYPHAGVSSSVSCGCA